MFPFCNGNVDNFIRKHASGMKNATTVVRARQQIVTKLKFACWMNHEKILENTVVDVQFLINETLNTKTMVKIALDSPIQKLLH